MRYDTRQDNARQYTIKTTHAKTRQDKIRHDKNIYEQTEA